jgi:aldose 1-epimerase
MPIVGRSDQTQHSGLLQEASARVLAAGDLEAVFLPGRGMLGASLRHRGAEILRRVQDLEAAAAKGSTAGIPLLHPWANRLAGARYRAAGREVELDPSSPLLHLDAHGLPMHGVSWARLAWEVTEARPDGLAARLDWTRGDLLAVFPFRHRVELAVTLHPDGLTLETTLVAGADGPVPVSFGFHPYLGLPDLARAEWRLSLPAMRRLVLDGRGIPAGEEEPFGGLDARLDRLDLDDGFALLGERTTFAVAGAGRRISVEFLAGCRYAQVFAPKDQGYVALEPMTAPTNALASGRGLPRVEPGGKFRAAFRIRVDALP